MRTLNDLLKKKLANPDFNKTYCRECAVCPTTVEIIKRVLADSMTRREIADRVGISVESIDHLENAESCNVDDTQKLCDHFQIKTPENCLQKLGRI
jgi:hypothetical protein